MHLDSIDRTIIRLLRQNARMPNSKLATEVGLSASACLRRVGLLEKAGVIKGYAAIIGGVEDEGIVAIVRITLERQTEEYLNRFESAVRRHPEIEECFLMTGDVDYILRARASSAAAYERLHKEILSRLPGVVRINSSIAMRSVMAARGA
ncbi:Lrp/AsnC family transcriptional regulator [Sphingomonas sp. LaA6.9]|uniref:Lrp/AsnC family transcriptional regulator n=1 Tax=Sphingomonas sp. LaA6.9 TaxID=2919914 RepID=UPI001F4F5B85|nr:Lrp/AsnC family transcriptional regulator [Sphingomonas sp. LaA6.9]MCJ8157995.1 Lrp/AsnC family transcriptional regulator [Sphingomonas sp. LaA6.9]